MLVELDKVTVTFPVYTGKARSLRANLLYLGSAGGLERDAGGVVTITALRNVSFKAATGDRIALVGRNGAGKTTLLKVISGIYAPSAGRVRVEGRVSPMLGNSLGVDEELTGHEAIEFACLLRGVAPARIPALAEEIAEFTELRQYLSLPVRTYSTGMKMRLGFAVATADAPEVLLIDESIMTGDLHFLEKARERADRLLESSKVLFLASHAENVLRENCNKALLLDGGEILAAGDLSEVLELYNALEAPPRSHLRMSAAAPAGAGEAPQGTPLQGGGAPEHPPAHALDGSVRTRWSSDPRSAGEAWIGYDFGSGNYVEVRHVTMRLWRDSLESLGDAPLVLLLQLSNDGFVADVRTAGQLEPKPILGRQSLPVPPSDPARYWRLIPAAPVRGEWGFIELDLDSRLEDGGLGRAISSPPSTPIVGPEHAFDDNRGTHWSSGGSSEARHEVRGTAWIGWDFGPGRKLEVRRFALRQWDRGGRPNTISRVKVQSSHDRFYDDVHTAAVVEVSSDEERHEYAVPPSRKARFWRILADANTAGGRWGVNELAFYEEPEGPSRP